MKNFLELRTYLTSHVKCFIPRCKARCCTNAPLPEDFLPRFQGQIQRDIYGAINIGRNDPRDTFNSVLYNTTTNPIQMIGKENGHTLLGIPKEVMEKLQIKSMEEIDELVKAYNQFDNYCPFITDYGRCSVYHHRPIICREFGSSPLPIDYCNEKSSRLDILKFYLKGLLDVKGNLNFMKQNLKAFFAKKFNKTS